MIQINENEAFGIRTTTVATLNYTVTYDFYDPKTGQTDTRIDTYDGAITTAGLTSFLNENSRIQRINYISIRNADGALTNKVTIAKVIDSIEYFITASVQLLTGEYMEYTVAAGWKVYDANGIEKYVGTTGPAGPAGTISAGTTAATLGQLNFINSNGISFGISSDSITASASLTAAANINVSAGTTSNDLGALTLSNSHGISFGLNGSVVTASHNGITSQTVQTQGRVSVNGSTSNIVFSNQNGFTFGGSASTITGSFSTLVFSNSNNVSFGISGSTLTASVSVAVPSNFTISAGTESISSGNIVFSNSNNVSFGMDAGTITASFSASIQSAIKTISAGSTLINNGEVILSNSNGVSFGISGNTVTASHNGLISQFNQAVSASNGSFSFQTLSLADSHGLSFSTGTQGVFASYTVPSITGLISAINLSAGSTSGDGTAFTFGDGGNVSFGLDAGTITASYNQTVQTQNMVSILGSTGDISFVNSNGITFGGNASTITASHNGLTSQSNQAFSAQGGSSAFQTLSFANSNGFTFSNSNGSVVASYSVPSTAGLISAINLSAGTTSNNLTKFEFNDGNGISFGLNGSTITASHNALTSQSNQAISAGNGSFTFQTATLANSNGLSFSTGTQGVYASYTVPSTAGLISAINISAGTTSNNLTKFEFNNGNGLSFGLNGSTITASHNGLTSQSNQALSAGNGSFAFQTASFADSNGISWSTGTQGIFATVKTNYLTTQTNQNLSLYATGNTTQNSSTVLNASVLTLNGLGNISLGFSNGSIQISQTGGAGGGIALANSQTTFATGTVNLSAAGALTIASATGQSLQFSVPATSLIAGSGAITVSTSGSSISISGGNVFYSTVFGKQNQFAYSTTSLGQNSIYFSPEVLGDFIVASCVKIPVNITLSSSATAAAWSRGHTASFAVYTRQAGTNSSALTRVYSTSYTMSAVINSNASMTIGIVTAIGNSTSYNTVSASSAGVNLTASVHGQREFILPWGTTLAPGEYWFAHAQSSSSGGGAGNVLNISHIIQTSLSQNRLGVSTNVTADGIMKNIGLGTYSATSASFPAAVTISDIRGGATWPIMYMLSATV